MCCAAIWSAVVPPCGSWLNAGRVQESHVPGESACTGPTAAGLSILLNTVVIALYLSSGLRMSPNSPISAEPAPVPVGVHLFITAP